MSESKQEEDPQNNEKLTWISSFLLKATRMSDYTNATQLNWHKPISNQVYLSQV